VRVETEFRMASRDDWDFSHISSQLSVMDVFPRAAALSAGSADAPPSGSISHDPLVAPASLWQKCLIASTYHRFVNPVQGALSPAKEYPEGNEATQPIKCTQSPKLNAGDTRIAEVRKPSYRTQNYRTSIRGSHSHRRGPWSLWHQPSIECRGRFNRLENGF